MSAVEIRADLVANVWKHVAQVGQRIRPGDVLSVLESMKMEIPVRAEVEGTLVRQVVPEGSFVQEGEAIWVVETGA